MERGSTSMLQPNEDRAAAGIAKPLSGEKSTKAEISLNKSRERYPE